MFWRAFLPLMLLATVFLAPSTTSPVADEALTPVSADPLAEMYRDPLVPDGRGGSRFEGQLGLIVESGFVTAALRRYDPLVQLIHEYPLSAHGTRQILARVPDAHLDSVIAALRGAPGVLAADDNGLMHLTSADR